MKRVLITGADSFIGTALASRLDAFPGQYAVDTLDMRGEGWKARSFAGYDAVLHVAGIAHSGAKGKETPAQRALYERVNTRLAIETAQKAKADGARQFIFMSSMIVYGGALPPGQKRRITAQTPPAPQNAYGESKLRAEQGILPLADAGFCVAVLRPPMVYGRGCRGNYPMLARLARRLPAFPRVDNERSTLYIGNLTEFLRLLIDAGAGGLYYPQNEEIVSTGELARLIAAAHGRRLPLVKGFSWALQLLARRVGMVNKAFGSQAYDPALGECGFAYRRYGLEESIRLTEDAL